MELTKSNNRTPKNKIIQPTQTVWLTLTDEEFEQFESVIETESCAWMNPEEGEYRVIGVTERFYTLALFHNIEVYRCD